MRSVKNVYFHIYDVIEFLVRAAMGYTNTRLSGARFGSYPVVLGKLRLRIRGEATFGEDFHLRAELWGVEIYVDRGATLTVGNGVGINGGVLIETWHDIRIGNNVLIASFATIMDDNRHQVEPDSTLYQGPTVIGDNVWIGRNVFVFPGVTIGSGSVIAANSLVSRNIPPNSLAAGSPARAVRSLDLPDGWTHRFGYAPDRTGCSLWTRLRRVLAREYDPYVQELKHAEAYVQTLVAPASEGAAGPADHRLRSRSHTAKP